MKVDSFTELNIRLTAEESMDLLYFLKWADVTCDYIDDPNTTYADTVESLYQELGKKLDGHS